MIDFRKCLCIFSLLFFLACSSMEVRSDYNPNITFEGLETFSFLPISDNVVSDARTSKGGKITPEHIQFFHNHIRKTIAERLRKKGLHKVSKGQADILIAYRANVKNEWEYKTRFDLGALNPIGTDSFDDWDATPLFGDPIAYKELTVNMGSLTLAILDSHSFKPIWKGKAQTKIDMDVTWKVRQKRIETAVTKILNEYPPE